MHTKRCALVSMPFSTLTQPSLALGILKSCAEARGHQVDVVYGDLALYSWMATRTTQSDARFDYGLISSDTDLGDVIFRTLLDPGSKAQAIEAIEALTQYSDVGRSIPVPQDVLDGSAQRIKGHVDHLAQFMDGLIDKYSWERYDVVGFTSTFSQTFASAVLATALKNRHPGMVTLIGGANVTATSVRALLETLTAFDFAITGEAESSFPEFLSCGDLSAATNEQKIPGLYHRNDPNQPPANVPTDMNLPITPDYCDYFTQLKLEAAELREEVTLPIEFSRGCWWGERSQCTFCGLNSNGIAYRQRDPALANEVLESVVAQTGVRSLSIVDNIIPIRNMPYYFEPLIGKNYSIFCEIKSNLRADQFALLAASGVTTVQPGIESLNTDMLRHMHKGAKRVTQLKCLKLCKQNNITAHWLYLYAIPGEDEKWYLDDAVLMSSLHHLDPPHALVPVTIERSSPLFESHGEWGTGDLVPFSRIEQLYPSATKDVRAQLTSHFFGHWKDECIDDYLPTLLTAYGDWQRDFMEGASLTASSFDDVVLIEDRRAPGRGSEVYVLEGPRANMYATIAGCPRESLFRERAEWNGLGQEEQDNFLNFLLEAKLLIRADGCLVPLPVNNHEETIEARGGALCHPAR